MEQMSWKMLIVTKAFLLYLTCAFKVTVARQQEGVCATCHVNATCDDKRDGRGGKVCNCMYGFLGNGRTRCQDKDECQIGGGKICGDHTVCHNTYGSFYCTCLSGYSPSNSLVIFIPNDGTQCNDIDECKVQGICGEGGWCINMQGDFNCRCRAGYKVQNGSQPFHPHRDKAVCTAIDCGQPPSVTHAAQLSEAGTRYGSVAQFGCVKGFFQTRGNNTAVCGEKGVWEGLSLVCEEIYCGEPPALPHSVMQWHKLAKVGTNVYYKCNAGYYNVGAGNFSVCNTSGQWDKTSMQCEEIDCGDPPFHPHSIMVWNNSTKIGTEVSYQCKPGFYNAGYGNVSLCTTDGYWNHANILCQEINCGPPVIFPNTDIHWDNTSRLGSVVHYTCDYGFYQEGGSGHSTCTSARVWEHITVACKEINCGPPAVFPNTDIHWDNTTRLGSVVHYTCKNGFYQEGGSSNSTCSSAREWEHITITCKEINCGPPDVFPNTDIHWDNTTRLGSVVHYTCKNGFYQEGGSSNSTCSSAREWEHITITCKARCGPPPSLPHTEVEWQNGSIAGSVALHSCQKGYRSWRGVNLSLCADTGRWQAATLFCREIKPAISKLLIFNEKCLRWKAERYDGQGEDYTVQIVGSRDYQRTFQYKRKRVFSTAADWPELCLNLLPGTNYTINITALSAGFSSIISANTSIQAPPVPEVVFRDVEVPLPSLRLRRSINTLDPISVYQVFVVPLERPVAFDCRSVSESHYHRQRPMGLYVAAQIPVVDIGRELSFTLGDQRYYGEYYNAPLLPGRDYYIILRAVNQWGRVRKQSCVFWAKARGTPYIIQSATMVTGGLIGLVAFVIFLGWYCKNK
ncbi:sushi domain-containing protein 1 isoform X6 [Conger conger]|uniref:sushi domain-containing protein 1 isoform X6 n=1 Tax=Conger conger TaxID=82655 RepID=UPI002A5A8B2C|nr:sushi domain-containing protein 1 isoform X6 [Conger conger]